MTNLIINGGITTNLTEERWTKEFLEWLESRNEYFGGGINIYDENEEALNELNNYKDYGVM